MKAIVYDTYGPPDHLHLKEVKTPDPKDNEVLIRIHACSVNDWDWGLLIGKPFANRLFSGLRNPKHKIIGSDIAGTVEAVGKNVKNLKPGDEVFGDLSRCGWGGFAEYVCTPENSLMLKPAALTFEQAAAVPQAGLLALQGLRHKFQLREGQKILVNGAGGGTGTFAIQIAKLSEVEVTGVDSTIKLGTMRSAGADHVIDYTKEDFTRNDQQYDLVLDLAAHHPVLDYLRSVVPGGVYTAVGGASVVLSRIMFLGPLISLFTGKRMGLLLHKANRGLGDLTALLEAGKIAPVIDKVYPLKETPEAMRYFGEQKTRGKVIITME